MEVLTSATTAAAPKRVTSCSAVFVGNLAWATTSDQLLKYIDEAIDGGITSVEVKRHEDTKRSKGWG
jgi:RNA recognition motif-containing protein